METVNEQRRSAGGRKQSEDNKCKLGMANSLSFLPLPPSVPSDSSPYSHRESHYSIYGNKGCQVKNRDSDYFFLRGIRFLALLEKAKYFFSLYLQSLELCHSLIYIFSGIFRRKRNHPSRK
jgi:hypothetical protein